MGRKQSESSATTPKSKGGRAAWATDEQLEWLATKLPEFIASRLSNAPGDFWPTFNADWFEKWPLPKLTEEDVVNGATHHEMMAHKKTQIANWLKNHSRRSAGTQEFGQSTRRSILDLTAKKPRLLPAWQAYSILFYDERLRDEIQGLWEARYIRKNPGCNRNSIPKPDLKWRNGMLRKLLSEESEEVQNEVERARQSMRQSITDIGDAKDDANDGLDEEERANRKRARKYQAGIDALDPTMTQVLRSIHEQTGLTGMFLLAGPEPMQGGNITIHEFFLGRWEDGRHFGQAYTRFSGRVRAPFLRFTEQVYPAKERLRRALPDTEDLANYVPEEGLGEVIVNSSLVATDQPEIVKERRDHRSKRSAKDKRADSQYSEDSDTHNESAFPASEDNAGNSDNKSEADDNDQDSTYQSAGRKNTARNGKLLGAALEGIDVADLDGIASHLNGGAAAGLTKAQSTSAAQPSDVPLTQAPEPKVLSSESSSLPINVRPSSTPGEHTSVDVVVAQTASPLETTTKSAPPNGLPLADVSESSDREARVIRDADVPTNNASTGPTTLVSSTGSTTLLSDRANWPDWLVKQIGILESVKGPADVNFQRVVDRFAAFEHALGYPEGQRKANVLSKVGRPDVVDRWIANARKSTPQVSDVTAFAGEWKAWWIGLQPECREGQKLLRIATPGERWEVLRKGGINGFFNVIVSLSWWCSAVKTAAQKKLLADMADDVAWVLTQMIGSVDNVRVEKPGKRSLEDDEDGGAEKNAKRRKRDTVRARK